MLLDRRASIVLVVLCGCRVPAFAKIGFWHFLGGSDWNPVEDSFGALPFIYGTLVTSAVAIVLAVPVAIGLAHLPDRDGAGARARRVVSFFVELLAAIPSVVYRAVGPVRAGAAPARHRRAVRSAHWLGFLPLFSGPPLGLGFLPAGILLAIMILPTIASVTIEVLRTVPAALREGALALGATRWEAIRVAVLPYARRGILGAVILGLARALGETMAVTMVIGNSAGDPRLAVRRRLLAAAVIANEFAEASGAVHTGALAGLALVLFGVTLILSGVGAPARAPVGPQLVTA